MSVDQLMKAVCGHVGFVESVFDGAELYYSAKYIVLVFPNTSL